MNGAWDPEQLRLKQPHGLTPASERRPPRHKKGEKFLKGPIPWAWLKTAMGLPGRALHVAIKLWFLAGLTRSRTVKLGLSDLVGGRINRTTAGRGLAAIEKAGLVTVVRAPGRKPVVTIQGAPAGSPETTTMDVQEPKTQR